MKRKSKELETKRTSAPPRSLYRKVQIALAEAKRGRANSVAALIDQIEHRGHVDFTRYRAGTDQTVQVVPCSKESIGRTIQTCISLGLVESGSAQLTRKGKKAADPAHFDQTMREAIASRLEEQGTPLQKIKVVIAKLLSNGKGDNLPTWDVIYEHLGRPGNGSGKEEFRMHLSLLSACHGITFSRKKIYLP